MRLQVLTISFLFLASRVSGTTLAPDTISNWQVYNNKVLVLAGHASPLGARFNGTVKIGELGDLEVRFFQDVPHQGLVRTVTITDEKGRTVAMKKFIIDSAKIIIYRNELDTQNSRLLLIEYTERTKGYGLQIVLGHLTIQDTPEISHSLFEVRQEDLSNSYRDTLEALRKKGRPFFEDDKYLVEKTCSGEWGGTIKFRNKRTGKVRVCSATCPVVVNKINGKYIVTASLAHMSGFSEILEIANPEGLSVPVPVKPHVSEAGKLVTYVGDDESKSHEGAVQLLDSMHVLLLGSFPYEGELFHVVTDYRKAFVARVENKKFVVVDVNVENLDTWTYDPEILTIDKNHFAVKIAGGYIDIAGNMITLMR